MNTAPNRPATGRTPLEICKEILIGAFAPELILLDTSGNVLAHVVAPGESPFLLGYVRPPVRTRSRGEVDRWLATLDDIGVVHEHVGDAAFVLMRVHDRFSATLARLRIRRVVSELAAALAQAGGPVPFVPPDGGASGAPAETAVWAPFPSDRRKLN